LYGSSKAVVAMITVQYAKCVSEVKFDAVEPGLTATDLTGGRGDLSRRVPRRSSTIGSDGPTGIFEQDDGVLPW
jgi:NAD(P)-dependent dehydrogenase (short-subunit alcohol dehydrogenase family)